MTFLESCYKNYSFQIKIAKNINKCWIYKSLIRQRYDFELVDNKQHVISIRPLVLSVSVRGRYHLERREDAEGE